MALRRVARKLAAQKLAAQKLAAQKLAAQKLAAQKLAAHGDHHRVGFLPAALPRASRLRGMTP